MSEEIDQKMRDDVLVTGPLLPYTGGSNANISNHGYGFTDLNEDGDFFCLGGFNWKDQSRPNVDMVKNANAGGSLVQDPGFSLVLGPTVLSTLSNTTSASLDDSSGKIVFNPSFDNKVYLSRNWPDANSKASVTFTTKDGGNYNLTKLYFKWVHPSYLNNYIMDMTSTSQGKTWKRFFAQEAVAAVAGSIFPPAGSVIGFEPFVFGQGCDNGKTKSSSDLIDMTCKSTFHFAGIGETTETIFTRHPKEPFLLRAYYPNSNGKLYPLTIGNFSYTSVDGNGKAKTVSDGKNNYLYLHYHLASINNGTTPEYTSSGTLELAPIHEITNYDPSSIETQQWAIDGGFLFDKSKFQFDNNSGLDSLDSWNIYVDPNRVINALMPNTNSNLLPFSPIVEPVSIPLNFVLIPVSWYNKRGKQYNSAASYMLDQSSIETQQCYRFYKNNPNTLILAQQCAAYISVDPTFESFRGVTQNNLADLTQLRTFYTSNNGCGNGTRLTKYSTIAPFESINSNKYTWYNSTTGYCSYKIGEENFVNSDTFPVPGCGYDGDCSGCSTDTCGDSICSKFVEDPKCKSTICSRAAALCKTVQGDPNWGSSSGSLIFIIILILAIFGLVIYYLYEKKQQNASLEGTTKKQTKTPQTSTKYKK